MDVANPKAAAEFCARFAERAARPEAARWFKANLRNWVLKESAFFVPVRSEEEYEALAAQGVLEAMEPWAKKALDQGRELHAFHPEANESWGGGPDLIQSLHGTADWFGSWEDGDRRWATLDRMSVPDAMRLSQEWHSALSKKAALSKDEDWSGLRTELRFPDGSKFVRLLSGAALEREGQAMGHCVGRGGYAAAVGTGRCEIYSLRDARNIPHATIEVSGGVAVQVKGTANTVVVDRWRDKVKDFLLQRGWGLSWDARRLGLVEFAGRVWRDGDAVAEAVAAGGDGPLVRAYAAHLAKTGEKAPETVKPALAAFAAQEAAKVRAKGAGALELARLMLDFSRIGAALGGSEASLVMDGLAGVEKVSVGSPEPAKEGHLRAFGFQSAKIAIPLSILVLLESGAVPAEALEAAASALRARISESCAAMESAPALLWTFQAEGLGSGAPSRSLPARLRRAAAFCGLGARFEAALAGGSRERRKTLEAAAVEAGRRMKDPRIEEARRREAFNAVRVQKPLAEAALKREFDTA